MLIYVNLCEFMLIYVDIYTLYNQQVLVILDMGYICTGYVLNIKYKFLLMLIFVNIS